MANFPIIAFFSVCVTILTAHSNALPYRNPFLSNVNNEKLGLVSLADKQMAAATRQYTGEICKFNSTTCEPPRMCRNTTSPNFMVCSKAANTSCFCLTQTIQSCNSTTDCLRGDRCYTYNNTTECISCNFRADLVTNETGWIPVDEGLNCPFTTGSPGASSPDGQTSAEPSAGFTISVGSIISSVIASFLFFVVTCFICRRGNVPPRRVPPRRVDIIEI